MPSIVLGIVLGSSLGYHMPISLLIAKIFHERRSFAFGIFRMGPGLSGAIVPLVGRDDRLVGLAHGGRGFRAACFWPRGCRSPISSTGSPKRKNEIANWHRRQCRSSASPHAPISGSAVHVEGSLAPQGFLVSFDGDGAAPYGHRRRVGALCHSTRGSRLEHGGGEQLARHIGADRRAGAHRHGLARRHGWTNAN